MSHFIKCRLRRTMRAFQVTGNPQGDKELFDALPLADHIAGQGDRVPHSRNAISIFCAYNHTLYANPGDWVLICDGGVKMVDVYEDDKFWRLFEEMP